MGRGPADDLPRIRQDARDGRARGPSRRRTLGRADREPEHREDHDLQRADRGLARCRELPGRHGGQEGGAARAGRPGTSSACSTSRARTASPRARPTRWWRWTCSSGGGGHAAPRRGGGGRGRHEPRAEPLPRDPGARDRRPRGRRAQHEGHRARPRHRVDPAALSEGLGVPVVATEAHRRLGIDDLRHALLLALSAAPPRLLPALAAGAGRGRGAARAGPPRRRPPRGPRRGEASHAPRHGGETERRLVRQGGEAARPPSPAVARRSRTERDRRRRGWRRRCATRSSGRSSPGPSPRSTEPAHGVRPPGHRAHPPGGGDAPARPRDGRGVPVDLRVVRAGHGLARRRSGRSARWSSRAAGSGGRGASRASWWTA